MKTKHILHGGSAQHVNSENDLFFAEILKDTGDNPKILLVEFAGSQERFEKNVQIDKSQFERAKKDRQLSFKIAREDIFPDQVKSSNIIYFGGGTTAQLLEKLKKFSNIKELFAGKVIAGESAGANVQATYCYSKSGGGIIKCLGLLPIKIWPHYDEQDTTELRQIGEELEIVLLPNYKYRVFEL